MERQLWRIRLGVLETSEICFSNHPQAGHKSQGIGLALQKPFLRLENRPIEFGINIESALSCTRPKSAFGPHFFPARDFAPGHVLLFSNKDFLNPLGALHYNIKGKSKR